MDNKTKNRINKELGKLSTGSTTLEDFLHKAAELDPAIAEAMNGIYCGESGKVNEPISGTRFFLTFNWYTRTEGRKPIVEYAYIS